MKPPALREAPSPAAPFTLELPTTADFEPGGMGFQCAVMCKAGCCRYFSLPIETPRSDAEFDNVRWYLMHEKTHVYRFAGSWYLLVLNECKNLLPNNLCGIYETRPKICREYDPTDCEYTGDIRFELYFDTAEKFEAWLLERKAKQRASAAKGARSRKRAERRRPAVAKARSRA